jgi:hypothetical protein
MPLKDDVRHAALAQVLAHRQTGLTAPDDKRFDRIYWHAKPSKILMQSSPQPQSTAGVRSAKASQNQLKR